VDFHTRLLRERKVTVNDSRPVAFEQTAETGDAVHAELRDWLATQLEAGDIVVKDPRTGWFLPLWTRVADELGADPSFVTMLRHPAEILASAAKSYGDWQKPASRAAAWINVTLETERATRGERRSFVRYEDLMANWPRELGRMGELLAVPSLTGGDLRTRYAQVDEFVDPTLHRNRIRWDELSVPASVRDMAEQVWTQLQPLADPGGDSPELHAQLDQARAAYAELYREAESVAQSSITAAKPRRKPRKQAAEPPSLKVRLARRVPAPARRRLRRALRRH
jgi:hypothetical protein